MAQRFGDDRYLVRLAAAFVIGKTAMGSAVVYSGSYDGRHAPSDFVALGAATGAERWRFHAQGETYSSPAVVGGTIYIGAGFFNNDRPGYVYAIGGGPAATPAGTATP
ncbi:MAG TPA: PQQ-binding-like beta-propeller repeat protein [Thermomicrobiales bacterium]